MPSVRNIRNIRAHVWVPPVFTANYKITVERSDGTVDDITDLVFNFRIKDGITNNIGNFEFEIPNPNETYTSLWTGMEIFRFYCDYASGTATTLRFRGRIERPSKRNNELLVTGTGEVLFVYNQEVYKDYVQKDAGYIINDLFDTYGESRFDLTSIDTNTGFLLDFTFAELPFWDAINAVCKAAGYDCYVNANLIVQFFVSNSRLNTTEAVVHDHNLIETGDFSPDINYVKNKVRVIGGTINGIQVIYTANDRASQIANGIRRVTIPDDGIITLAAAKELANAIKNDLMNPPEVGNITSTMLATIQPGEKIWLSDPLNGIQPNSYRVESYEHIFGDDGLYTVLTINKEPQKISSVISERIQREHKKKSSSGNVDDLDFSEIELFNRDSGTRNNTVISDGILALASGQSSGTWVSYNFAINTSAISKLKVELFGDNVGGTTIEYSINSGTTWNSLTRNVVSTIGAGTKVLIRLSLVTGSTVDSMSVKHTLI